jgi:hypothetical protein
MENLAFITESILGMITGCIIGLAIGIAQQVSRGRSVRIQKRKRILNAWLAATGALKGAFIFLLVILLIQMILPALFDDDIKWMVSGGVVLGYAAILLDELGRSTAVRKI